MLRISLKQRKNEKQVDLIKTNQTTIGSLLEINRHCNRINSQYYISLQDVYFVSKIEITEQNTLLVTHGIAYLSEKGKEKTTTISLDEVITLYYKTTHKQWLDAIKQGYNKVWWGIKLGWKYTHFTLNNVCKDLFGDIEKNLTTGINDLLKENNFNYTVYVQNYGKIHRCSINSRDV